MNITWLCNSHGCIPEWSFSRGNNVNVQFKFCHISHSCLSLHTKSNRLFYSLLFIQFEILAFLEALTYYRYLPKDYNSSIDLWLTTTCCYPVCSTNIKKTTTFLYTSVCSIKSVNVNEQHLRVYFRPFMLFKTVKLHAVLEYDTHWLLYLIYIVETNKIFKY